MVDLRAALWSQLPFEIVEHVLSCVPVPGLCRYRNVCKRWNQLISNRDLGALCARTAKWRVPFMTLHYARGKGDDVQLGESRRWGFLDLNARRWYLLDRSAAPEKACFKGLGRAMAMDGGLVICQYMTSRQLSAIVVYNPVGKALKELPAAPDHWSPGFSRPLLNLVVDKSAQCFKVFLLMENFRTQDLKNPMATLEERSWILNDPLVRCYSSTTNEWKDLSNPSLIF